MASCHSLMVTSNLAQNGRVPIFLCSANIVKCVVIGKNVYMYDREVVLGLHVGVSQFCLLPPGVESVLDEAGLDFAGSKDAFGCLK